MRAKRTCVVDGSDISRRTLGSILAGVVTGVSLLLAGCSGGLSPTEWSFDGERRDTSPSPQSVLMLERDERRAAIVSGGTEVLESEGDRTWPELEVLRPPASSFKPVDGIEPEAGLVRLPPGFGVGLSNMDASYGHLGLFRVGGASTEGSGNDSSLEVEDAKLQVCETARHFYHHVRPRRGHRCIFFGERRVEVESARRARFPELDDDGARFVVRSPSNSSVRYQIDVSTEMPSASIPLAYISYRVDRTLMTIRVDRLGDDQPAEQVTDRLSKVDGWAAGSGRCDARPCSLRMLGLSIEFDGAREDQTQFPFSELLLWASVPPPR